MNQAHKYAVSSSIFHVGKATSNVINDKPFWYYIVIYNAENASQIFIQGVFFNAKNC